MKPRSGFSLLEVILALAVTTAVLGIVGSMLTTGLDVSQESVDMTMAQLLCESVSSHIAAGTLPADPIADMPVSQIWALTGAENIPTVDEEDEWMYSVELMPLPADAPLPGTMMALVVTVYQNRPANERPASYSLVRWIRDPGLVLPESETDGSTSSSASSSTTSSSPGGF